MTDSSLAAFKPSFLRNGRLGLPVSAALAFIALSTLLRVSLSLLFPPPNPVSASDWAHAFLIGLYLDVIVSLWVALPWVLVGLLPREQRWRKKGYRTLVTSLGVLLWTLFIFLLVAEGFFFEEYQSRYNPVALDYLIYPHEVFVNIWEAYPIPAVVVGVLIAASAVVWWNWRAVRWTERRWSTGRGSRWWVVVWIATAAVLTTTIRIDLTRFSKERTINELSNNTFVSGITAALTRNLEYAHFYPTMPRDEAFTRARKLVATPDARFAADPHSLRRTIPGDPTRPKLNVVMLLEESLGSEFWGSLGRANPTLTPRMDALATREGLLFENMYADGNRTIRGYEALLANFPPLPGDSIVARDRSDRIETMARLLARDGYDTTFLYAGRGLFDGTGPFMKANGWQHFLELKDYRNPVFTTVWGVCNEDLYDRLIEECRDRDERGLPFLMTTMTVSNHKPYTYPPGRIPEDPNERTRANVVKYTDYALGRFFDKVRQERFWTNTIFVVVADHGARVYGSQTIPIRSYEIPFVVLGPAVVDKPRRISTLGSQLDVIPTILGMVGRPYESILFGRDLLKWPDLPNRCLLHHNRSIGIYADHRLVVFSLGKKIEYFEGDPKREQMRRIPDPSPEHLTLQTDATALYQVSDELYMNRRYFIEP